MEVKFAEVALAGARRLVEEETARGSFISYASLISAISLALYFDPTKNAFPVNGTDGREFWVRVFFVRANFRVLFELSDEVVVWSISSAT